MLEKKIKALAFDCFGTVFDMMPIPNRDILSYVEHVRKADFAPYAFPASWLNLKAHEDSAEGIKMIQKLGIKCVALSNGSYELLGHISKQNGIEFDHIVNLAAHRVYKPHQAAYLTVQKDLGIDPGDTLMVTANPTFGDLEGAESVGMHACVIRHDLLHETIVDLAVTLKRFAELSNWPSSLQHSFFLGGY